MKRGWGVLGLMCLAILALESSIARGLSAGSDMRIVAWGSNDNGQCNVPSPNADFVAVAGGGLHTLGLRSDGTIVAWGNNDYGQCDVPSPNADFVAVACSDIHSLGLKSDSTIVAWGYTGYGLCNVPSPNAGFVAIAGGAYFSLGLKFDGTIVSWGSNDYGESSGPLPNADFVAIAGGSHHGLGLKSDSTIVPWGSNNYGQCTVPSPNADFVAVAGGSTFSLGLKSDSTIVAWGSNNNGQCNVPSPNADFVAIACGENNGLGLKSDSTIVAWGYTGYGLCDIPPPNAGFAAVAGGKRHNLGLRSEHFTAVAFSSIAADSREGAIVLQWGTAADEALSGFRLYRALCAGDFSCITASPLPPSARAYEDRAIEPGTEYRYAVAALTPDGREIRSPEVMARSVAPSLALNQNVPNPFNPQTTIGFSLPGLEHVRLDIFDLGGRLVQRLIDKPMQAGHHQIEWNGKDERGRTVASGMYFYRLTVSKQMYTKKMILLK